jgi:hypothetical protein
VILLALLLIPTNYVARSYSEGIAALRDLGPWDTLLLDYDLASYDQDGRERTGFDVLVFLEEHPDKRPSIVKLVTSNPVGRKRMMALLVGRLRYYMRTPTEFYREE